MMVMAGIFGVVLIAVLGTYYFRNKKRHRKAALLCKALDICTEHVQGNLSAQFCPNGRTE